MKSDDRAMKKWPLFYAILKNSPMMRTGSLEDKLRGRVSRSDFFEFLKVYERKEKIIRPTRGLIKLVRKPGFWERRAERKQLANEREELELDVEGYAIKEEARLKADEYEKEMTPEKCIKRRQKYRRLLRNKNPNVSHRN